MAPSVHAQFASLSDRDLKTLKGLALRRQLIGECESGRIRRAAAFLALTFDGQVVLFESDDLRALDIAISDDMLCCLDALRWGMADLHTHRARRRTAGVAGA